MAVYREGAFPFDWFLSETPVFDGGTPLGTGKPVPQVTAAVATSSNVVRVSFSDEMKHSNPANSDDALNPANYIFSVVGGAPATAASVTLHQASPTIVDVTLAGEMTNAVTYNVEVQNVETLGGQVVDPSYDNQDFTGLGTDPWVSSASAPAVDKIRVVFNDTMRANAALVNPLNYVFAGPTTITADSVAIVDGTTVEVTILGQMRQGSSYTVTVSGVEDQGWNPLDIAHDEASFIGLGHLPWLLTAVPLDAYHVRLTFNEAVDPTTSQDETNYVITGGGGLAVVSAVRGPTNIVELETAEQTMGVTYIVTVSNVEDLYGNVIDPSHDQAGFGGLGATRPVIVFVEPQDGGSLELDQYLKIQMYDDGLGFTGLRWDQSSIKVTYVEGGETVVVWLVSNGYITEYGEGEITGEPGGKKGLLFTVRLAGGWPPDRQITVVAECEDGEGYEADETAYFNVVEEADDCVVDLWPLVPEEHRRIDADNSDALHNFLDAIENRFEYLCRKIAKLPELRDPYLVRSAYDEWVTVTIAGYDVDLENNQVVVEVVGDLTEVSRDWVLNDGTTEFRVLAVRKQDNEIDIEGIVQPVLGASKYLRPQSMIELLGLDFGVVVDKSEAEGFQRGAIANAMRWFDLKGTVLGYTIRGLISGFDVDAHPLWAIADDLISILGPDTYWLVDDQFYTSQQGSIPNFDEIAADSIPLDQMCFEDPTDYEFAANVTSVARDLVTGEWVVTMNVLDDLTMMAAVGRWKLVDSADNEFWVESFTTIIPKTVRAAATYTVGPATGGGKLVYLCEESNPCWWCKTNKMRVEIEAGEILDEPGADVGSALDRLIWKIYETVPAHVELLFLVYITYLYAEETYTVDIQAFELTTLYGHMVVRFDEDIAADEVVADSPTLRASVTYEP